MKFKMPKITTRTVTSLVLFLVILVEFYLAYFYLYNKLSPQPEVIVNTAIVRINRNALNEISRFLDGLDTYQPEALNLANPNPLKYSP